MPPQDWTYVLLLALGSQVIGQSVPIQIRQASMGHCRLLSAGSCSLFIVAQNKIDSGF